MGVNPSSIVLGLGFYGRSFALQDSACWKPGCAFTGPGAAGPCTDSAGILSYRGKRTLVDGFLGVILIHVPIKEIQEILQSTGGSAYLDESAAARYIVYDNDNWVS